MSPRQPLPRVWLVTDERMGGEVVTAARRVPQGAGILFRHYSLAPSARRRLFDAVREAAPGRLTLLAGSSEQAGAWGADGFHGWEEGDGLHSVSVHNLREMRRAKQIGADLLFAGPVFPTRSHPGAVVLGSRRFAALAARSRRPMIALGGITPESAGKLIRLGAHGWAAVDEWLR